VRTLFPSVQSAESLSSARVQNEYCEGNREPSKHHRHCETKNILARPSDSTRILGSCATLLVPPAPAQERHSAPDKKSHSHIAPNKKINKQLEHGTNIKKPPLARREAKNFRPKSANLVANRESNPHSRNALCGMGQFVTVRSSRRLLRENTSEMITGFLVR
jgi:hypothetical protein